MTVFEALILGTVQGLTEFFPISSSGHLAVLPVVLGLKSQPLVFDTFLHLGTAAALVVYFRRDLLDISAALLKDVAGKGLNFRKFSDYGRLCVYIIIGSIPAGVVGLLLGDFIEADLRGLSAVSAFLILGSVLMFVAERFSKFSASVIDAKKSFVIGLFQSLALFPGISRSGSTISAGMLSGLGRDEAARFSFLLSVPIVVMAAAFKVFDSFDGFSGLQGAALYAGFISSFLTGLLAIKFLLGFLRKHSLYVFIVYRLVLALLLLL